MACKAIGTSVLEFVHHTEKFKKYIFDQVTDEDLKDVLITIHRYQEGLFSFVQTGALSITTEFLNSVIKVNLDEEMKLNYDTIVACVKMLNEARKDNSGFKLPMFALMLLVAGAQKYKRSQGIDKDMRTGKPSKFEDEKMDSIRRIGEFAFKAYTVSKFKGKDDSSEVKKILGLDSRKKILHHHSSNKENDYIPKFIAFIDDESKSVVLAVRGTKSHKDILIDLVCSEAEFLDGCAPQGMLMSAQKILDKCERKIAKALENNPGYKLIITGHSLGGGVSILIAMIILSRESKRINPDAVKVKCYAFAPPPVFCKGDLKQFKKNITIIINGKDCVPRLSLASVEKFLAMMKAIDAHETSFSERKDIYTKEEDKIDSFEKICGIIDDVPKTKLLQMEHPGKILHINRDGGKGTDKKFILYESKSKHFRNLVVYKHMIRDHGSKFFAEALQHTRCIFDD